MLIVDSHCHVSEPWYEPVESLLSQMDRNGVEHAILIQIKGQTDNRYQQECARRYAGRFSSVVLVDWNSPDACEELRRLADDGASGVRFQAVARSPGEDPLAIWRAAEKLGLAVSCAGTAAEFSAEEFAGLVRALPGLTIVLEHLGSGSRPDQDEVERQDRRRCLGLARFPNLFIKVHGLGEFCRRAMPVSSPFPFALPIPSLLEDAFQSFGPQRMMWGSDFPPVSGREGYRNALQLTMQQFAGRSEEERALIFGRVAQSVFPIRFQ